MAKSFIWLTRAMCWRLLRALSGEDLIIMQIGVSCMKKARAKATKTPGIA